MLKKGGLVGSFEFDCRKNNKANYGCPVANLCLDIQPEGCLENYACSFLKFR